MPRLRCHAAMLLLGELMSAFATTLLIIDTR